MGSGDQLTGVNGSTGVLKLNFIIPEGDLLQLNLPVCLATNRSIGKLTSEGSLVNTTEEGLATIGFR